MTDKLREKTDQRRPRAGRRRPGRLRLGPHFGAAAGQCQPLPDEAGLRRRRGDDAGQHHHRRYRGREGRRGMAAPQRGLHPLRGAARPPRHQLRDPHPSGACRRVFVARQAARRHQQRRHHVLSRRAGVLRDHRPDHRPAARQGGGEDARPEQHHDPAQPRHRQRRPHHRGGGVPGDQAGEGVPHPAARGMPPAAPSCSSRTRSSRPSASAPTAGTRRATRSAIWCGAGTCAAAARCRPNTAPRSRTSTAPATRRADAARKFQDCPCPDPT